MKNAGKLGSGQRLSHGAKDPSMKPGKGLGLDWDKLREKTEERLDREWDEGVRRNDTIRRRWMKSLTPAEQKVEQKLLDNGQRTPLELGPDGEPHPVGNRPVPAGSNKSTPKGSSAGTGRPRATRKYDVDEIVRMYEEDNLSPVEIRDKLAPTGPAYETVVIYLKKRGVFDPNRHRTGGARSRDSYEAQWNKHCGVCGIDLDVEGNSKKIMRKLPDGTSRPNGRECIPCRRRRSRENYYNKKANGS